MWMIYITFERRGSIVSNITAMALAYHIAVQQNGYYAAQDFMR
jgi:hypothetical protein